MIERSEAPVKLNDSVYWLGISGKEEFLQTNVFLILRENSAVLIDPGPPSCFPEILTAFRTIAEMDTLKAIVVSTPQPAACAGLPLWEKEGFSGKIITHWQAALQLQALETASPLMGIHRPTKPDQKELLSLEFFPMPYLGIAGALGTYDPLTRTVFSALLFSSLGKNLPLYFKEELRTHLRLFHEYTMPSNKFLNHHIREMETLKLSLVCPQHGPLLSESMIPRTLEDLKSLHCGKLIPSLYSHDREESSQLDDLRKINFKLQENLVLTNDEKIRDPVTGLYNVLYFESFLPAFLSKNPRGTVALFRLDEMQQFNHSYGFDEGDNAIAVFARLLLEHKPEDCYLFRSDGPVLVFMQPDSYREQSLDTIKELQNLVAESDGFLIPMTASAAVMTMDELPPAVPGEAPQEAIQKLLYSRIKVLDRMGKNSLCSSSAEEQAYSDRKVLMIIESDPINADFLGTYFRKRGLETVICMDGSQALHLADLHRPSIIFSEVSIREMDMFRIRKRLLSSPDLKDIPFVVFSHQKTEQSLKRAFGLEIEHYLKKPVSLVEMEGLIQNLT